MVLLFTSCAISGVDADEEGVFIAKPWIFGSGGVYDNPLKEGTSITAASTQVVRFKVIPQKYAETFDDVMSDDNTPVDLQAYVILQIERGKTPTLLKNYGEDWYNNNVRETFRKFIRDRVSTYPMYDLTSNREACQKIEDETLLLLQSYFDKLNSSKELPVKIISVIVDRATPNKEVMEEINKTASQIQAKKTQTERESKSIICDESHRVKDIKTQTTKFVKGISVGKEYVYLLTGTPVVNKPDDLVSQIGILDRMNDFGGYQNFKANYCDNSDRFQELNYLLKKNCFYRREKADVLKELPPKMRQIVLCDITTRKEYSDALSDLEDYLKRYRQASDAQIQKSMKGEIMVRIGILKNISARGKIKDAIEYISDVIDSGEKLILFTHLREVQDMIMKSFPAAVSILGDDDTVTRQKNVDRFQNDPKVQLIVCSIKAAGVGITLTASSRVAFLELPWHPADCEQCEDRAHRIGQLDSVQCTYLLGKDTIDEHIYEIIDKKRSVSNAITGARDDVEVSVQSGVINLLSKNI